MIDWSRVASPLAQPSGPARGASGTSSSPQPRWRVGPDGRPLIPPLDAHTPLVVGVDASVTGDCSAIIGVTRAPWAPKTEVLVRTCRIFTPPTTERGGKKVGLDYAVTIEAELRRLVRTYNVVCVPYDPYQMHMLAQNLLRGRSTRMENDFGVEVTDDGSGVASSGSGAVGGGWRTGGADDDGDIEVWMAPFSQAGMRNEADKMLYDLIRDRRLWHGGDPELTSHILNAAAKTKLNEDTQLRIIKKPGAGARGKIDGCIALGMACYMCLKLNLE